MYLLIGMFTQKLNLSEKYMYEYTFKNANLKCLKYQKKTRFYVLHNAVDWKNQKIFIFL